MTDKQIIIDEIEINPNDWLLPYKDIPACEIKDCNEIVYCGDGILGCRIAETGLVCDDFNNPEEACMYRQLEYYKEALKRKEQECERLEYEVGSLENDRDILQDKCDQLKAENDELKNLLKVRIEDLCDACGASSMMPMPCKVYEKTLTEIKEIVFPKNQLIITDSPIILKIQEKISECEGNDEIHSK